MGKILLRGKLATILAGRLHSSGVDSSPVLLEQFKHLLSLDFQFETLHILVVDAKGVSNEKLPGLSH